MLHVTCDLCGKKIRAGQDQRYVVRIEAYAVDDPAEITEADLDQDHMEMIGQLLQECEENDTCTELVDPYQNFRYDLCSECHKRFVQDPMAREREAKFHFSKN